ncbi:MAG: hypothetical protein JXQ23_12235 [Clostridia bacterium]|nr:hypothetical protein [Clostridia bacterium]
MKEINDMSKDELIEIIKFKNDDIINLKKEIEILMELIEEIKKMNKN